jgi:hypothetical protein
VCDEEDCSIGAVLVGLCSASILPTNAHAAVLDFSTTLLGSSEVPPVITGATGTASVELDTTAQTLFVSETFSGLIGGPATAAHIHCCALPGNNADVAVPFTGFPSAT